jgi:hypothetical protein
VRGWDAPADPPMNFCFFPLLLLGSLSWLQSIIVLGNNLSSVELEETKFINKIYENENTECRSSSDASQDFFI